MARIFGLALFTLLLLVLGGAAKADTPAPGYHVIKKFSPGGEGGWDYLTFDSEAHRLYVSRATRVMVIDVETEKVVGEVANTPGVHGVALVPKLGRGFTSNGKEATVTVFDMKSLAELARIKVGAKPDAIIYDPSSGRVFTMNASGSVTAIDAEKQTVVGTIELGGKPEFAAADEKGHLFVNLEDKSEVVALDATKLTVEHRWPLAPGTEPAGMAIDRAHGRLFSTCHNQMMVVLDAESGKVLATPSIGKGTDAAGFDPETNLAFSSNGDGTLTVVREEPAGKFEVAETVTTQAGARTVALDPKTHNLYLVTATPAAVPKPGERRSYEPGTFVVLVVGK